MIENKCDMFGASATPAGSSAEPNIQFVIMRRPMSRSGTMLETAEMAAHCERDVKQQLITQSAYAAAILHKC